MRASSIAFANSLYFNVLFVMCFAFLLTLSQAKTSEEGSRIRPGLLTGPSKNTQAKEGESVEFRWTFALSSNDTKYLQHIDFGFCYNNNLNKSLIKIHKTDQNNSTIYSYNVTEKFVDRLQWLGGSNIVSFVLTNVTRKDSNSYVMVMSFGDAREPISDHVELIVTYPPKILNKPVTLEQVRFPEGVSVQISCVVQSCPRAQVTWYHDGRVIQKEKEKHDLTINKGQVTDSGVYRCEATNDLGSDFKQVLVIVTSCKKNPSSNADSNQEDKINEANDPDTLFTMIAPAVVFFVIFTAYFFFRCPANRNRRKRNRALVNSKATSTPSFQDDEQTTSLLADWSNFSDRGEKV